MIHLFLSVLLLFFNQDQDFNLIDDGGNSIVTEAGGKCEYRIDSSEYLEVASMNVNITVSQVEVTHVANGQGVGSEKFTGKIDMEVFREKLKPGDSLVVEVQYETTDQQSGKYFFNVSVVE